MSTIVAVLRAYCRNRAASVTQFQTESYRQAGYRLLAGSQVESKDRVEAKTIMFFSMLTACGSSGCKDEVGETPGIRRSTSNVFGL